MMQPLMNYLETKEGQKALKEGLDQISRGLKLLKLPPYDFGKYMLENSTQDQKILALKKSIVTENDQHKLDFNDNKAFLLLVEYIAIQLMKNNYDME